MIRNSFCRFCTNSCPILVEVEDGRAVRVTGDRSNPIWEGYTCVKGRALPEQMRHPERLLQSQKRMPDGSYASISSALLMDEVAERLAAIVDAHGADAVASYTGTMIIASPMSSAMTGALMRAIGSRMTFSSDAVDQIGKKVAWAMHGRWSAPPRAWDEPDVTMLIGSNPLITYMGGFPMGNPGKWLQRQAEGGHRLIVVDPRRSDTAKRATIHLQPRPGEDVSILAAMVHVILGEDLYDHEFVAENVDGIDTLRATVEPFTPAVSAARADIDPDDLVRAARVFADASRGVAVSSTGPNMSGPGTLVEYLTLSLNTLCGRWMRAGEQVRNPGSIVAGHPPKAQPTGPTPAYDLGEPLPATGLRACAGGLPTASLPDEILSDEPARVRALLTCGGNPVAAWPDQLATIAAMRALELLVQVDVKMSATAKLAHYVVATTMGLEVPSHTMIAEGSVGYGVGYVGLADPWAQYTEAVCERPADSDLLEEWEFFYGVAQRMGLTLTLGAPIDMEHPPTTEGLLAMLAQGGRIPLDEVRRHPGGALFPDPPVVVAPKDADCDARLDVANADMMRDLTALADEMRSQPSANPADGEFGFRLVNRRIQQMFNSSGHVLPGMLRRPFNPAFMHPSDLERLHLEPGDLVEVRSARAAIVAVVEPDADLRTGLVSMTHAFGGGPDEDHLVRSVGSSTSRLLTNATGRQPYTAQPRMSNVPVAVRPAAEVEPA